MVGFYFSSSKTNLRRKTEKGFTYILVLSACLILLATLAAALSPHFDRAWESVVVLNKF